MNSDRLSPPERMMALITKEGIDRVPINPILNTFAAVNCNMSTREYYLYPEKAFNAQLWTINMYGYDGAPSYDIPEWANWDFGGDIEFPDKSRISIPRVIKRVVECEEDALTLEMPDPSVAPASSRMIEFSRICIKNGFGASVFGGSPMSLAQQLTGTDLILKWMIKKPEIVHILLRKTTDHILNIARLSVEEFGAENITVFSAYPMDGHAMISSKQFEKFSLPYIKEIHEDLIGMGINAWLIHLCGDHKDNLDYWINDIQLAPRSIFTVGSEMDIALTAKKLGDDYIIAGNVKNTLLQTSTPSEVYEETRKIIEKMKYTPGGFFLTPDCGLSPITPPANLYAMIKAAKDFGRYE